MIRHLMTKNIIDSKNILKEIERKREIKKMRCPNCGNQASWRDPDCNKCDAALHQKNCKGKSADCKCHEINEQSWATKKAQQQQQ